MFNFVHYECIWREVVSADLNVIVGYSRFLITAE